MENTNQNNPQESGNWSCGCILSILFFIVCAIAGSITPDSEKKKILGPVYNIVHKVESKITPVSNVGEIGQLIDDPEFPYAYVFSTQEALQEYEKHIAIKDREALHKMYLDGNLYEVKTKCSVRVIESGGFLSGICRVRILEGENYGKDGLVRTEWVKFSK